MAADREVRSGPRIFASPWITRGLRLSLVAGIGSAAWHSWTVFSRYDDDRRNWAQEQLTYECAARFSDGELNKHMNEMGNINVKGLCLTDRDFWVAPYEIVDVRKGTMKFETSWEPFDGLGTLFAAIFGAVSTILVTVAILCAISLVRWVWGGAGSPGDS